MSYCGLWSIAFNVWHVYAVPFAAINNLIVALRQTAWSEHNNIIFKK